MKRLLIIFGSVLLMFGCAKDREPPKESPLSLSGNYKSYLESVQPIFDKRCVVCHSCNDAPCQLNQTSYDGVTRGASATEIYADRLFSIEPSRLGIDAKSTIEWRKRGFFPVVKHNRAGSQENLDNSILFQLISARVAVPKVDMKYDSFSSRSCPNLESTLPKLENQIAGIFRDHPNAELGMPYGFPPLTPKEFATIRDWLILGAPGPNAETSAVSPPDKNLPQIETWERFFNGQSVREKLVARYIYEHLYYAHLYFRDNSSTRPKFYRLVRSRTAAPTPADEIATRFPTSSPGPNEFYYRFIPIDNTIVSKTHLPFELSDTRLEKLRHDFLSDNWSLHTLPGYESEQSANPFVTFASIPARARYQFMLDDAEYVVGTFMKGPVCRGQLALNVINDFFFIFFLDPDSDPSITEANYLHTTGKELITPFRNEDAFSNEKESKLWAILELPGKALSQLRRSFYPYFKKRQLKYLAARDRYIKPLNVDDIWDGDGSNQNAVLTVFRHFDSASVRKGAFGGMPKTAMVLDYPIYERMYYNLVANYDVYSDIKLQLATRLYMDDLRIEAEDLFLSFLPLNKRVEFRNFWYRGAEDTINGDDFPFYGTTAGEKKESLVRFGQTPATPQLLIDLLLNERTPFIWRDDLNAPVFGETFAGDFGPITDQTSLERELAKLGGRRGAYLQNLPPASVVRFQVPGDKADNDLVYTLLHSHAHLNVKYLFREGGSVAPEEDTLSVMTGFEGSYPNFYFDVPLDKAQSFLKDLVVAKKTDGSFNRFIDSYGVRRGNEDFWEHSDWFNEHLLKTMPITGGTLDLNRYENF